MSSSQGASAPPCILVILGASGDLTQRLLVPAIYNLASTKALADDFRMLGVAAETWDDEAMRSHLRESIQKFWGDKPDGKTIDWIASRTFYQTVDLKDKAAYEGLAERVKKLQSEMPGNGANLLFYLALAPSFTAPVSAHLSEAHLFEEKADQWRRLIIEKPFGQDQASAAQLTKDLKASISEEQIYHIDHFSGKEAAHDIAVVRFTNTFLDAIWNRSVVDNVQITIAETVGVEKRGSFYEKSGALRDMVPNHMLELLSITAMEKPDSRDADAIHNKQVELLKAIKVVSPDRAVRAQYTRGSLDGCSVAGYLQEPDVNPNSKVETYVAMKVEIDNDRWSGVPFYLRTGKRMTSEMTEVALEFKQTANKLFEAAPGSHQARHALIFRLKPDNGVHLEFTAKEPGMETMPIPAEMIFKAPTSPFGDHGTGYERLLRDAMMGDKTLFHREDFIESGWHMVDALLKAWKGPGTPATYEAGSQGPVEADKLLSRDSRAWRAIPEKGKSE